MTCIVGYINKETKTVHMGGDSAGVAGLSVTIRKDPKVFKKGPFIIGFTSSFRMGQLLMSSKFNPPKQSKKKTDYDYMVTDFIDEVRRCFKEGGYLQSYRDGDEKGGTFLVGYKGVLYQVENDFQVAIPSDNFTAVGCGGDLALGAIYSLNTIDKIKPKDIVDTALNAASYFSGGVEPPYTYLSMSKKKSSSEAKKLKKKSKSKKNKK